jgi:hypothetical protein
LDAYHPLARRETSAHLFDLPPFFARLVDPWRLIGYSAILNAALFLFTLLFNNPSSTPSVLMPLLIPFLTPIGSLVAAAMLHSLLYWAMLIGVCNQTTYMVAGEFEKNTWRILRTTPIPVHHLLLAKVGVVFRQWARVLRVMTTTRIIAVVIIGLYASLSGMASNREVVQRSNFDVISGIFFTIQPWVDAFFAVSLSIVVSTLMPNRAQARYYAYGAVFFTSFLINGIGALWWIYTSPLGGQGSLLVPLGFWSPLIGAVMPPTHSEWVQTALVALIYMVVPIAVGALALRMAVRNAVRMA